MNALSTPARVTAALAVSAALLAAAGCGGEGASSAGTSAQTTSSTRPVTTSKQAVKRPRATSKDDAARAETATRKDTPRPQSTTRSAASTKPSKSAASTEPSKSAVADTTTRPATAAARRAAAANPVGTKATKGQFGPRLRVEAGRYDPIRSSALTIDVTQRPSERKIARMSVIIPAGYGLSPLAAGKRIGDASVGLVRAGKLALLPPLTLDGSLVSAKRSGNRACVADPVWVLKTTMKSENEGKRQTRFSLTFFIHKVEDTRRITVCVPAKTTFPNGATLRRVTLRISSGLVPPGPGDAVWRGLFTPRTAGGSAAAQGTTESQGIVPLPTFLTLKALGKKRVQIQSPIRLQGVFSLNGPASGRRVRISLATDRRGFQPVGSARTNANGGFTFRMKAPEKPGLLFFHARALSHDVPCRAPSAEAPAGCTSATVSGMTSASTRIAVVR